MGGCLWSSLFYYRLMGKGQPADIVVTKNPGRKKKEGKESIHLPREIC
jgi:hypothetical protein